MMALAISAAFSTCITTMGIAQSAPSPEVLALLLLVLHIIYWFYIRPFIRTRQYLISLSKKLPGTPVGAEHAHPWLHDVAAFRSLPRIPGKTSELRALVPWFIDMMKKYGSDEEGNHGLFRIWAFNPYRMPFARCTVILSDPDLILDLCGSSKFGRCSKGRLYTLAEPLVGSSFLSEPDGMVWKQQRRLCQPAFGTHMLERATMVSASLLYEDLFPIIDNNLDKLEISGCMNRLTLDVLGHVAFSYPFGGLKALSSAAKSGEEGECLYDAFDTIITTIILRARDTPLRPLLPSKENFNFWKASRKLNAVVNNVVQTRFDEQLRSEREGSQKTDNSSSPRRQKDLLSQLLLRDKDGSRLSKKYIAGNVRMLCFAGHETTSSTLSYALWHLASNRDIQQRLREEIDPLFPRKATEREAHSGPKYAQLRQLRLLDAVVKETLRLHAPAGVARRTLEEIKIGGKAGGKEYTLPKGIDVMFFPCMVQRLPSQWEDPDIFCPDRFFRLPRTTFSPAGGRLSGTSAVSNSSSSGSLDSTSDSDDSPLHDEGRTISRRPVPFVEHSYMPFSVGPRSCIGQELALAELRTILAHLVHRYFFEPADALSEPIEALTLTIQPNEVLLRFQKRGVEL